MPTVRHLEGILLSEVSQSEKDKCLRFHPCVEPKKRSLREADHRYRGQCVGRQSTGGETGKTGQGD